MQQPSEPRSHFPLTQTQIGDHSFDPVKEFSLALPHRAEEPIKAKTHHEYSYLLNGRLHQYEKVLFALIEEKMSEEDIETLPYPL
jgi:hypothetical protein